MNRFLRLFRRTQCSNCVRHEKDMVEVRKMCVAIEDGVLSGEAVFGGAAVKLFAASMVQWFRESGGRNYVTVEMRDDRTGDRFEVTMQRIGGETPAQQLATMRKQVEDQRTNSRFVHKTLVGCRMRLEARGVRHSWIDPAIDIAEGMSKPATLELPDGRR